MPRAKRDGRFDQLHPFRPRWFRPPSVTGHCSPGEKDQLEMTLKWLKDALVEADKRQKQLDADKAALDKLGVTTDAFDKAYAASLADDAKWIQALIDTAEEALEALKDSGCDLKELNRNVQRLRDFGLGYDATKDLFDHDLRKPLNLDVKGGDDDDQ